MLLKVKMYICLNRRNIEPNFLTTWKKYAMGYQMSSHNNIYTTLISIGKKSIHLVYQTCNDNTYEETPGYYY